MVWGVGFDKFDGSSTGPQESRVVRLTQFRILRKIIVRTLCKHSPTTKQAMLKGLSEPSSQSSHGAVFAKIMISLGCLKSKGSGLKVRTPAAADMSPATQSTQPGRPNKQGLLGVGAAARPPPGRNSANPRTHNPNGVNGQPEPAKLRGGIKKKTRTPGDSDCRCGN